MGRMMPTECPHGVIIDWGDFCDEDPEPCEQCDMDRGDRRAEAWRRAADAGAAQLWSDHQHDPAWRDIDYVEMRSVAGAVVDAAVGSGAVVVADWPLDEEDGR